MLDVRAIGEEVKENFRVDNDEVKKIKQFRYVGRIINEDTS